MTIGWQIVIIIYAQARCAGFYFSSLYRYRQSYTPTVLLFDIINNIYIYTYHTLRLFPNFSFVSVYIFFFFHIKKSTATATFPFPMHNNNI